MLRSVRSLAIAGALALVVVASASANWAGSNPPENYPLGKLPLACDTAPMGKTCIDAAVYYLDKARAKLGQPAYALPADFSSLTPNQQMFILTNLDRVQYGLPPMTGLVAELNSDAYTSGVKVSADPSPSDTTGLHEYTSNWAGGYGNAPMAYEAWMWDDGLGSDNIDCTSYHRSGCWGHRHNILWRFDPTDVLAMGAATGNGPDGRAYTTLLVGGFPPDPSWNYDGYTPTYSYTWDQAVADGAGTNAYDPGIPQTTVCQVRWLVGMKLLAAKRAIKKAHCQVGAVVRKHTVHVRGYVIRQHPEAGTRLPVGAKLRIVVSLGPSS